MKFLITGATGFIGSYLSKFLIDNGHQVIAITRHITPTLKAEMPAIEWIEGDMLHSNIQQLKIEADVIIHLAAANDIVSKNAIDGITLSAGGTRNMLQLAVNNKINRFIFYSTLQVYGTELSGMITEDSTPNCESDYGINHLLAEQYVEMYARKFGLHTAIVRPSNIYGEMAASTVNRWTLVPGCFIKSLYESGNITLLSSGKQNRNFISLLMLSQQTLQIANHLHSPFQIYNLASNYYNNIYGIASTTFELYKAITGNAATLEIKSELPLSANQFEISLAKLNSINCRTSVTKNELEIEIEKLIRKFRK
ncbi:MAG: hypothetical protein RJA07_1559 [Bacteroidota bacterium]|jgi:nucleoside-diphosphate-sugar epimerase